MSETANSYAALRAQAIGTVGPLNAGERKAAEKRNLEPRALSRAWEYWTVRLEKADGLMARGLVREPPVQRDGGAPAPTPP